MSQQPGSQAKEPSGASSGSAFGRIARFVGRHPGGAIQSVFFALIAIVILQNVEPTSIDVLFWSIPSFPKLLLIFLSMLLGAGAWELIRRWPRR